MILLLKKVLCIEERYNLKATESVTFSVPFKNDKDTGAVAKEKIVVVNSSVRDDERPLEF